VLETYDWNQLITEEDRTAIVQDIKAIIEQGDWYKNSPKYQTQIDVFSIQKPHWSKLRMAFFWSCFAYLGREVSIAHLKSWGMITSSKWAEERDSLWHDHAWYNNEMSKLSGVFYVHLPQENIGDNECGTEFAPEGINGSKFYCPPLVGQWAIYPASWLHRPGVLKSEEERFIVAADLGWNNVT